MPLVQRARQRLMKIFPVEMKVSRGEVHIIENLCKGCGFCVTFCPMGVLELSTRFNVKGYHFVEVKDPDNCINCEFCGIICPDFAIWSTLKEEKRVGEVLGSERPGRGSGRISGKP